MGTQLQAVDPGGGGGIRGIQIFLSRFFPSLFLAVISRKGWKGETGLKYIFNPTSALFLFDFVCSGEVLAFLEGKLSPVTPPSFNCFLQELDLFCAHRFPFSNL